MLTTLMLAAALAEPGEAELEARLPERRTVPSRFGSPLRLVNA